MPAMNLPPIGLRLARTARTVSQEFERAMADAGGSASTWQVLLLVKTQQWGNQSQMAEALGITGATLTHHLNAMEKHGLVHRWREESNRRVQQVALTQDGEAMFERLRGAAMAHDARLREGFSEEELAQLASLLDRLKASVDAPAQAGGPA
jgi:MarR family transcriptional regulator for hemolysin